MTLDRGVARELGRAAVEISKQGFYHTDTKQVWIGSAVQASISDTVSLPPDCALPVPQASSPAPLLIIRVANITSLAAARHIRDSGRNPLILNFANAIEPGGGFLSGALAQEEYLARSTSLFVTIAADPMYTYHRELGEASYLASDWAILSPAVSVFRGDDGCLLENAWDCSILTCAAPVARQVGVEKGLAAMESRVPRVLSIAEAFGYRSLVLGAWGCGAFRNDPLAIAKLFRVALGGPFLHAFDDVVFAIADWSPGRNYLGPFRDTFRYSG